MLCKGVGFFIVEPRLKKAHDLICDRCNIVHFRACLPKNDIQVSTYPMIPPRKKDPPAVPPQLLQYQEHPFRSRLLIAEKIYSIPEAETHSTGQP